MHCEMVLVSDAPNERGKYRFVCALCGEQSFHRDQEANLSRVCKDDMPDPGFGPGTELMRILRDGMGVSDDGCNSCKGLASLMNRLGVERTLAMRELFKQRLEYSAGKRGWAARLAAAGNALINGLAWRLDLRDPYGSLIDEACRRATLAQSA